MKTTRAGILLVCASLYLFQLGVTFAFVRAANHQGVLTGEEASVSFRDVLFLGERIQHNPMATAFGAYAFYAVGSRVMPRVDLFFGRWWKALFMSLLPVLIFLFGRRLGLALPGAVTAALVTGLLPPVVSFSWLATDHGLEMLFGFASLLLVSSGTGPILVLAGLLAGWGALMAIGTAFLPVFFLEVALFWRSHRTARSALWAAAATAGVFGIMVLPTLWWTNSPTLLTGGGELAWPVWPLLARNGCLLAQELVLGGGSYYYFNQAPALSNPWLALVIGAGLAAAAAQWRRWWPVLLLGGGVLGIVLVAGGVPGIRRALILCPIAGLLAGKVVDELRDRLSGRVAPRIACVILTIFVLCLVAPPAWQACSASHQYADRTIVIPDDFEYARMPGKTMVEVIAVLLANPALLDREPVLFTFDRMMSILHILAARNGKPAAGSATVGRIMADWRIKDALWEHLQQRRIKQ